jgi:hypothetical protein
VPTGNIAIIPHMNENKIVGIGRRNSKFGSTGRGDDLATRH